MGPAAFRRLTPLSLPPLSPTAMIHRPNSLGRRAHSLSRRLPHGLLALLTFAASGHAGPQRAPSDLLKLVRSQKDGVEAAVFAELARHETPESFKALQRCIDFVEKRDLRLAAYEAFALYPEGSKERSDGLALVTKDALHSSKQPHERAASEALAKFGADANPSLERVLLEQRDEVCRRFALLPLLDVLVARGDSASARLVLRDGAGMRQPADASRVREALTGFPESGVRSLYLEALGGDETPHELRLTLLDVVQEWPGEDVTRVLSELVSRAEPAWQVGALKAIAKRQDEGAIREVYSALRSKDAAVRKAAVETLGVLRVTDPDWADALLKLAASKDSAERMGSAAALAQLRTQPALAALRTLLRDEDRVVRAAALQQVGNLRRLELLPDLFDALDREVGQANRDVANVLRLVTGLDHGLTSARWRAWWSKEGKDFRLPSYEDALAAERARAASRSENRTGVSFYGLQVISERVCFVVDVSGSMQTATNGPGSGRTGTGGGPRGSTRLAVAKEQLGTVLDSLSDGTMFNVVFFSNDVFGWEDELVRLDAKSRADAREYVDRQRADGATAVFNGLERALSDARVDTIYLLTDGDPTVGKIVEPLALRREIARLNEVRMVRIHTLSIGADSELLKGLAADSGGDYRRID